MEIVTNIHPTIHHIMLGILLLYVLLSAACFSVTPLYDVYSRFFLMLYLETQSHMPAILTGKEQEERRKYE